MMSDIDVADYQYMQGELMAIHHKAFDAEKGIWLQQLLGANSAERFRRHLTYAWVISSACGLWIGGWVITNYARFNYKTIQKALPAGGGEDPNVFLSHAHLIWETPPCDRN